MGSCDVLCSRSTVLQQQFNKKGNVETGSVALPAIMRSGAGGPESFQMGSMPQAKQHITSGQMHRGHMAPLVRDCIHTHKHTSETTGTTTEYVLNRDVTIHSTHDSIHDFDFTIRFSHVFFFTK